MQNKAKYEKEDKIKEISEKVYEIESLISTIISAQSNEYDVPEPKDIQNSLNIVLSYIKILKQDISNFIVDEF